MIFQGKKTNEKSPLRNKQTKEKKTTGSTVARIKI